MLDENERSVLRRQRKEAKLEKSQLDAACRGLLAKPEGRKYLWWLLSLGKIGENPHTNNALATAFNCGEMNVSQRILAHITEVDPAGFVRMQQENQNVRRAGSSGSDSDGDDTGND